MSTISRQRLADTFVRVADTLVEHFDLIDFLTTVTERAAELAGSEAAGLLLSDQQGRLQFMAASTESAGVVEMFQVQRQEGPCQDCFRLGAPVTTTDLAAEVDRWPVFAPWAVAAGYQAVHAFPLRYQGSLIGTLNLLDMSPRQFSSDDSGLLKALADAATIGILQERAIREAEALTEQLQRALNGRVIVEQAKGALSRIHSVRPDAAFEMLRDYSRRHKLLLTDVADAVLHDPASHPALTTAQH